MQPRLPKRSLVRRYPRRREPAFRVLTGPLSSSAGPRARCMDLMQPRPPKRSHVWRYLRPRHIEDGLGTSYKIPVALSFPFIKMPRGVRSPGNTKRKLVSDEGTPAKRAKYNSDPLKLTSANSFWVDRAQTAPRKDSSAPVLGRQSKSYHSIVLHPCLQPDQLNLPADTIERDEFLETAAANVQPPDPNATGTWENRHTKATAWEVRMAVTPERYFCA